MKVISKVILSVLILVVLGIICYRGVNTTPSDSLPADKRLLEIMADGGCASCHTAQPKLPFYANMPFARKLIQQDITKGYHIFDYGVVEKAIKNGSAVPEVDLAKIERSIADGKMPLAKYYLVHWGSQITSSKNEVVMEWIKQHRQKFYPNPLAAAEFANETIRPIPDKVEFDPAKAELGKRLYHDTRLSADGSVSCATCHGINTGGVDNLQYSQGIAMQQGDINAPTVFNAVFNFVQFWDGRAKTLADQAAGPPLNPVEMGCKSFDDIVKVLGDDKEFTKLFTEVYPEGWSQHSITDAIEHFERTLITPNSAFDRYLKGDEEALTAQQIRGFDLFKKNNCATCHAGENMGGLSYEPMISKRGNYFRDREAMFMSALNNADNGRWNQTKVERDKHRFRTPGLRNVALTFPYFHDGSVETLDKAVSMMAFYLVGNVLDYEEIQDIKAFLKSLTGEYQGKLLENDNMK